MAQLLAEDLLLVLTRPGSGRRVVNFEQVANGLGAALLLDLALLGRIGVPDTVLGPTSTLDVHDASATGDDLLDAALAVATRRSWHPYQVVGPVGAGSRRSVGARLLRRGLVAERRSRVLGVVPRSRLVPLDTGPERELRASVVAAMRTGDAVSGRAAAVAALVSAMRAARAVSGLDEAEVGRRLIRRSEPRWVFAGLVPDPGSTSVS